jgi:type IX secretion system PorP/SprF family membrane protein
MKRLLTRVALIMAGITGVAHAQQDPQFTQFMFNKLIYNPGYAGTTGAICGVLQYRQQWVNFPGAPQSLALSADTRLSSVPVGLGLNVISDKSGPMNTMYLRVAGAYNLTKLAGGTLGIGIDFGILQKKINDMWITPERLKYDPRIPGNQNDLYTNSELNTTNIDLGAGVFYQIPGKFYAGISSTHLPAQSLKSGDVGYKVSRHYYIMTGYTFQLNKWSKLTPNILYKTDIAASSMDLNLTYLWSDMIWIGGTYRADDATAVLLGYQGKAMTGNALSYRIGYSYDFSASKLAGYNSGTHEILLGACYTMKVKKPTTYSDPRFLD